LSAIGDACHAVATVQAIQRRYPKAKITWIIGKIEYQLLSGLPGVEFIIFDKKAGLKGYFDLRRQLKGRYFDILLHMQVALRASLVSLLVRAKQKWGFDKARSKEGQSLFVNRQIQPQTEPHVADGFFAFAKAIGVPKSEQLHWQMPLETNAIDWYKKSFSREKPYLVIAPVASKAERNWLPERYAAVAKYAHQKGFDILICGGPTETERQMAQSIQSHCDFELNNLVGKTSLKQLLVVLKEAAVVLAPDTGPAHMAVTLGTPVIGLYMHSNPKRTGPYHYLDSVVSHYDKFLLEQTGQASEHHPWGKRLKGELMHHIQVDEVIEQLKKIISL
jgi:heptosyltransferase I